jgi:hypothetical protein
MPSFSLRYSVAGAFEGAASVRPAPAGGAFALRVRLRCTRCSEEQAKVTAIDTAWGGDEATVEVPGSKGLATLVQKCGSCASVFSLDVTSTEAAVEPFTSAMAEGGGGGGGGGSGGAEGGGAFLAALECRGCEPVAFEAGGGWTVHGAGGTAYDDVNLDLDDFAEFDEAANCGEGASVAVGRVVGTFTLAGKGKR